MLTLSEQVRLHAGKMANMHWSIGVVYGRNASDPRLPQMRDELSKEIDIHRVAVWQLKRLEKRSSTLCISTTILHC